MASVLMAFVTMHGLSCVDPRGLAALEPAPSQEAEMDDPQIHGTIEQLVAEEHELWQREAAGNADARDRQRLRELKVSLDQCWDLLRQRRALREAGRDPDAAEVRRSEVVERYDQ
jgi:uncharacterized protein DUF2630